MFVSRVAVSLRIPGLKKKSLVKITSPVHNCRMVEVSSMDKLVRVLRNFGVAVSNPNRPFINIYIFTKPVLCGLRLLWFSLWMNTDKSFHFLNKSVIFVLDVSLFAFISR